MQLVLDHEVGRRKRRSEARTLARLRSTVEARSVVPLCTAKEGSGLSNPRERCEFIDCCDQESWQPTIERLVYGQDGERPTREVTFEVRADDTQLSRLVVVR